MTMDVVWNCAYGIDVDVQNNPNLTFFVKIKNLLNNIANFNFLIRLLSTVLFF